MRRAALALGLLLAACEARSLSPNKPAEAPAVTPEPAVAKVAEAPARQFGAAPSLPGDPIAVSALLEAPDPYLGKQVKCEGKVAQVCQNAGCWLELQAESGGEGLRVPMANHAFFIPKDAVGKHAVIEGALKRRELPEAQKAHYQGEGLKATGPLSLEAVSVVLR